MKEEKIMQYAIEAGFAKARVIDTAAIVFDFSFRDYCKENLCGNFGKNYTCPPDCGSPEEMKQKIIRHKKAVVLQSIWDIADFTDKEAIKHAQNSHNAATGKLYKRLSKEGCEALMVGAGGCALCSPCKKAEGKPCAHPEMCISCMSAYCIFVKPLAESCNMQYESRNGKLFFLG